MNGIGQLLLKLSFVVGWYTFFETWCSWHAVSCQPFPTRVPASQSRCPCHRSLTLVQQHDKASRWFSVATITAWVSFSVSFSTLTLLDWWHKTQPAHKMPQKTTPNTAFLNKSSKLMVNWLAKIRLKNNCKTEQRLRFQATSILSLDKNYRHMTHITSSSQ